MYIVDGSWVVNRGGFPRTSIPHTGMEFLGTSGNCESVYLAEQPVASKECLAMDSAPTAARGHTGHNKGIGTMMCNDLRELEMGK